MLLAWWRRLPGESLFLSLQAVRTPTNGSDFRETSLCYRLQGVSGLCQRWPELWNIARGEFAYGYVFDGKGSAAHVNLPFQVDLPSQVATTEPAK